MNVILRNCPVCLGTEFKKILTDTNRRDQFSISFSMCECENCGMHFLNPAPDETSLSNLYRDSLVDKVSENIEDYRIVSKNLPKQSIIRNVISRLNGSLRGRPHNWPDEEGNGRSILDFGCLDGTKLAFWYQRGWQIAGIDINEKAIAVAKRQFPEEQFWCGDLTKLKIDSKFDYIRADNVLEHVLDPVAYMKILFSLLKPGGKLRIFVPNYNALSVKILNRYSYVYWMPFHLNLFSKQTLNFALRKAGFQSVSSKEFNPIGSFNYSQVQYLFSFFKDSFRAWEVIHSTPNLMHLLKILNYPVETITQWLGFGEEVIGTGIKE